MAVISFKYDTRISEKNRKVLRDFSAELGGDPVALAIELGLKVYESSLPQDDSGYIAFDPLSNSPSGFIIVVNQNHSSQRKKFTVAHELGHFVLHRNTPQFQAILREQKRKSGNIIQFPAAAHRATSSIDDFEVRNASIPRAFEREADLFAATILLPPHALKRSTEYIGGEPAALARRLGLSISFVIRQFEEVKFGDL